MPSYVVTGVSSGLGYEFLRQLSSNPANIVVGIVRNKPSTEAKASELGRNNIHIVQGDLTDYSSLEKAAQETREITGGKLDYLISNAAAVDKRSAFDSLGVLGQNPRQLEEDLLYSFRTNAVGTVHLINAFMPLILKGQGKKVIAISTGAADNDLISKFNIALAGPYAISKAALNTVVAKFSAEYAEKGVLVMAISPGFVETGQYSDATPEQLQKLGSMVEGFKKYAPNFDSPIPATDSVQAVLNVMDNANIANGDGGTCVSHHGNKQWL